MSTTLLLILCVVSMFCIIQFADKIRLWRVGVMVIATITLPLIAQFWRTDLTFVPWTQSWTILLFLISCLFTIAGPLITIMDVLEQRKAHREEAYAAQLKAQAEQLIQMQESRPLSTEEHRRAVRLNLEARERPAPSYWSRQSLPDLHTFSAASEIANSESTPIASLNHALSD